MEVRNKIPVFFSTSTSNTLINTQLTKILSHPRDFQLQMIIIASVDTLNLFLFFPHPFHKLAHNLLNFIVSTFAYNNIFALSKFSV